MKSYIAVVYTDSMDVAIVAILRETLAMQQPKSIRCFGV